MKRTLVALFLLGLLAAFAACGQVSASETPEQEAPGTEASYDSESDVGLEGKKYNRYKKHTGAHKPSSPGKPDAKHQPPKYPSPEADAPYYPPPGPNNAYPAPDNAYPAPDGAYPAPGDSYNWWRKHDAEQKHEYKTGGGYREPRQPWGEYAPPRDGYGTKDDYGYGDYYAPHYGKDDRPYSHYRPDPPPPKGCNNKLPPACQTFAPASLASTDHYSGSNHYPAPPSTPKSHTPTCASTGAVYAWSPTCAAVTPVNGQCPGAALCQPGNGAAESVATCTASGWVVTNECSPTGCSGQPTSAPENATFVCNIPGFLNQVCPATCEGGLTSTVQAVCSTTGWLVSGCCVPANMTLYNTGNINLQKGWTVQDSYGNAASPAFDQAVVDAPGGGRVWRMSNAVTSGGFSNQPNTYSSCEVAGETGSFLYNNYGTSANPILSPLPAAPGTNKQFFWSARFKSATGAAQSGLALSLAVVARQSTWRMTNLRITDTGSGFNITVNEVETLNGVPDFLPAVVIATGLSYTDWHTITTKITFVDGIKNSSGLLTGNDIVQVFVNGELKHTGSTWEAYYYSSDPGAGAPTPRTQAVDSVLFRASGQAAPGTSGAGFYFDDVVVSNSPPV